MTKCIVLLSGGQDSTTSLYWAKQNFDEVHAIGFNYGQKHVQELAQAMKIAVEAKVPYTLFNVKGVLGGSSLVDHNKSHLDSHPVASNLPASFTAGRNMLFLTIAAGLAFNMGIEDIVTGVCQTDYSGYPDCRREFIDSAEKTLALAMDANFVIHTPLMYLTKAETFRLAFQLGCLDVIINDTMTDYNGDTTRNEWGMGVNNNPATELRMKGYYEAKANGWLTDEDDSTF